MSSSERWQARQWLMSLGHSQWKTTTFMLRVYSRRLGYNIIYLVKIPGSYKSNGCIPGGGQSLSKGPWSPGHQFGNSSQMSWVSYRLTVKERIPDPVKRRTSVLQPVK